MTNRPDPPGTSFRWLPQVLDPYYHLGHGCLGKLLKFVGGAVGWVLVTSFGKNISWRIYFRWTHWHFFMHFLCFYRNCVLKIEPSFLMMFSWGRFLNSPNKTCKEKMGWFNRAMHSKHCLGTCLPFFSMFLGRSFFFVRCNKSVCLSDVSRIIFLNLRIVESDFVRWGDTKRWNIPIWVVG